jgi:hypothetical protein
MGLKWARNHDSFRVVNSSQVRGYVLHRGWFGRAATQAFEGDMDDMEITRSAIPTATAPGRQRLAPPGVGR